MPVGDTNRHIVAMGGGGFSMEPDNLLLDRYVLALAPQPTPTVCFIPTASGDSEGYIARFYAAFAALPCTPTPFEGRLAILPLCYLPGRGG